MLFLRFGTSNLRVPDAVVMSLPMTLNVPNAGVVKA
jgi:hypothetical protein